MEQEFAFFVTDNDGMNRTEPGYSGRESVALQLLDNTDLYEDQFFLPFLESVNTLAVDSRVA